MELVLDSTYQKFVLETNTTVYFRISDNVLEAIDWSIIKCGISNGIITEYEVYADGVYAASYMPRKGWNIEQIMNWLNYDSTGFHPQTYHELLIEEN